MLLSGELEVAAKATGFFYCGFFDVTDWNKETVSGRISSIPEVDFLLAPGSWLLQVRMIGSGLQPESMQEL
jgi:hypothetical protein